MSPELKLEILEGAKKAFFEAMLDGYAGDEGHRSIKTKDDDGYTTITYPTEDGKYKVVDRYCTTPLSDKSAGTTTIFYRVNLIWVPVWWMTYGGQYKKEAISFLKFVLKQTYRESAFCCGRGPDNLVDMSFDMEYQNYGTGNFERFEGAEEIFDIECGKSLGSHKFYGMSLL